MTKKLVFGRKMLYLCSAIKGLNDMRQHVFYEGDREQGIKYANEAIDLIAKTDR